MKKTTLFTIGASLLLAVPSIVRADAGFKSGFKVGLGAGYKNHRVKSKAEYDASEDGTANFLASENFKSKLKDNTSTFEIHGGYDYVKNRFLAAFDLSYRYSLSRAKTTFNTTQERFSPEEVPFNIQQKHPHDFGLSFNVGGLLTSSFAVYAIGNIRLGRFEHKFENNKATVGGVERAIKKAQYRWGLGGGLGCRYALSDGLSIGVDATHDVYQRVKSKTTTVIVEGDNCGPFSIAAQRPHITNVLFKVVKTF